VVCVFWDTLGVVSDSMVIRPARGAESDRIAEIVFGEPEQVTRRVAAALYRVDDAEVLRPLFRAVWAGGENWRRTHVGVVVQASESDGVALGVSPGTAGVETVSLDGERIAGIVQLGQSSVRVTVSVSVAAARALGVRALVAPRALRLAARVAPTYPAEALIVSELHVAPEFRGEGIAGRLLAFAEAEAVRTGHKQVALHTFTTNPARSLYERSGYRAVREVTDVAFERRTGVAGNVLYVKDLTQQS
jgi:GNAT superfamily N-acetyltransferase